MTTKFGSYTGTGVDGLTITGVGFQADLVIVIGMPSNSNAIFRVTSMGANASMSIRGDTASMTNGIKSMNSDGFVVGTDGGVNTNTVTFLYMAVKEDSANDFKQGSYTGDGADGKAITGLGFQPAYVLVKPDDTIVGAHKFSGTTDTQMQFGGDDRTDLFASLDADGFTLNNGSGSGANLVNRSGIFHNYFAFKNVPGFCTVVNYTGNGVDNRDITTPNFQPSAVIIKGNTSAGTAVRTTAHTGDQANFWDGNQQGNRIQSFISTGFQVGTDQATNQNTTTYSALVLKEGTSVASAVASTARAFMTPRTKFW